jgi:hypothetical protein
MSWHVDEPILDRYVSGTLGGASMYSVEAHLVGCARCRGELSPRVDAARVDRVWAGVRDRVDAPRTGPLERMLVRAGVPAHIARLLMATPLLRPSWIVSVAVSLAFAVLTDRVVGAGALPFLIVAPLVPVFGVAVAFARPVDPVWEIGAATPVGGFRLTMIRAVAVLGVSVALAALAAVGLSEAGWTAVAWLLPSLGLTALTLAISTSVRLPAVAGAVAASWCVVVVVSERLAEERLAAFDARGQILLAAIAIASIVVVVARRDAFERRIGA